MSECSTSFLLSRRSESYAREQLIRRYRWVAFKESKGLFAPGLDRDDLIAEGIVGLDRAITNYTPARGPFVPHAMLCARRAIITRIIRAKRGKHSPLNDSESFDADTHKDYPLTERLPKEATDPLQIMLGEEKLQQVDELIAEKLSPVERDSLRAVAWDGLSYEQTAGILGVDPKAVDNAIQRARIKLRPLVEA